MEHNSQSSGEAVLIFDNFDLDLVVKVLSHTAFSPFFLFLLPSFFFFQGHKLTDIPVLATSVYWVLVSSFWFLKWYSRLYRNQGSLLFGPGAADWGEQIVLITGGASGVGELLANTLAVRNVTVVVLDVKPIVTENFNITYYKCDVTKQDEVEAVARKVIEEIGHPTILVNNAGVVQGKLILDLSPEDIRQTFDVNTLAHFWTLKAFLPEMIKKKSGHIVTVASITGLAGMAQLTDYCASKAAVISLHESLRYELDKRYHAPQIRTSLVVPSHIQTPLFSTIRLPNNRFFRFCFPSLEPVTVVKAIIATLDEQHSQTIYLPFIANLAPLLRLLPSFLRDFAQWYSDADYAMKSFIKITGRREDEGAVPELSTHTKSD
ncbi:retinal short-chain dehydrogenase/reductase [Russula ochroleuca]|jgi:NAD(P)-dependent dehydrogenase (short-subunit alcohol dehydrogenase family)|uniref:Short-chain dehydrogenase/reductase 3 n=1 Tax=Russula ochroleuca TaxID=152965 RepID=A0A9P5N241_9AGAM|nr:retinal short-chain dehydrogenase/reductase [Russula ochroleuca]